MKKLNEEQSRLFLDDLQNILLNNAVDSKVFLYEIKQFFYNYYFIFFQRFEYEELNATFNESIIPLIDRLDLKSIKHTFQTTLSLKDKEKILADISFFLFNHIKTEHDIIFSVLSSYCTVLSLYARVLQKRNIFIRKTWKQHIKKCIELNLYDEELITSVNMFSEEELTSLLDFQTDFLYDATGIFQLKKRYLLTFEGECMETPQEMYFLIACMMFKNNKSKIVEIYELISQKKVSLATPITSHLRLKNFKNLSSCFILQADDSILSLFHMNKNVALISQQGGGVGINLSRVRSVGMDIKHIKNSSTGTLTFIKLLSDITLAVNQSGKRKSAFTVSLDIWHLDFMEFLHSQLETGNIRLKSFDIFPQVVMCDLFMKKLENNEMWSFFDPSQVKKTYNHILNGRCISELYGEEFESVYELIVSERKVKIEQLSTKSIMRSIIETQIETGLPYIFFKDTVNRKNPNKHAGIIPCGNLCQESFSNVQPSNIVYDPTTGISRVISGETHVCNLASINASNVEDDEMEHVVASMVDILNSAIDLSITPTYESFVHNQNYRTIGIGVLGFHDVLAKKNLYYGSNEAIQFTDEYFESILFYAVKRSVELARIHGPYKKFFGSEWSKGNILGLKLDHKSKHKWLTLVEDLKKFGIYNSQLMSIAPNTSTSLLQSASASVLPIYNLFILDSNAKNISVVFPRFILSRSKYYVSHTYSDLKISSIINMIARVQKWTDQGISFELLFDLNKNISGNLIQKAFRKIWLDGIKTIYYVRSIQKSSSNEESNCDSCSL